MEELLRNLMNCGFIVFKRDANFVLKKIPTPRDPRESITDEVLQSDTSTIVFDDYAEALRSAKKLISDELAEDEMIVRDSNAGTLWKIQIRYQHRGLGMKIEDLGELPSVPYPEAVRLAEQRAQEFADNGDNMVEKWEVKVFPYIPD